MLPVMTLGAGRPRFTLPAASALRDRADRVTEQSGRKGRPRRRYLNEQRTRLARRLLPTMAVFAMISGAAAIGDLLVRTPPVARLATLGQTFVTILLGACALAVPLVRKNLVMLRVLAVASALIAVFGWSFVARETGGGESQYFLAAPLCLTAIYGLLPMTPRIAAGLGVAGYMGLLVAAKGSHLSAHVMVLSIVTGGYIIERARHKRNLLTFMRLERLRAAVSRMRRVQEQLVVVEKLEALRVLVGGMAHELNNALAVSLASYQQALKITEKTPADPAAAAAAIRRGDGGLARIKRTVDRLRRFAMAAEGVLEPADVGAMLDFALESAVGRARSGVIIDRFYDADVGPLECHVAALAEALFQVARNAVEAMPGGGTIRASVRREGDRVILAVADEGRGIPPEQLAKVFDPFYQGRPDAAKSGLGLSAVYGLVTALGGSVDIKSDVGKGTEVALIMPSKRMP